MFAAIRTHSTAIRAAVLALISLCIGVMLYLATSPHQQPVSAHPSTTNVPQTAATPAPTATLAQILPAAIVQPKPVQLCTPLIFNTPSALDLTNASTSVSIQSDAPAQYQVYGNTASDLRTQIQRCAPSANGSTSSEFTGQTVYYLNWQYTATPAGGGCMLTDVRVGLHTTIAMPYWQPTGSTTPELASRWQTFVSGLTTHEQGHVDIDKTYAADLYQDLDNLGAIPCDAVATDVQAITNSSSTALDNANDAYDAATDHGATQGAILPAH